MNTSPSIHFRLKHQHEAIKEIIAGLSKERMMYHPAPGKWSIHDNIAHLGKYQPVFIQRLEIILKEDSPLMGRYRAEDDPEFETWRSWDTEKLLEKIYHHREKIIELVNTLNASQLKRTGVHKKFGKLALEKWLEFFLLHEAHHLFTIFQLANDVEIGTA